MFEQTFSLLAGLVGAYAVRLVLAAIVVWGGFWLIRRTQVVVRRLVRRAEPADLVLLEALFARGIQIIGVALIVIAALAILGVNVSTLLASLGLTSLVLGFALKDIIEQTVTGILLLLIQPFHIGDVIEVEGIEGEVTAIGLRTTDLRTSDGIHVLIPNNKVYQSIIRNKTRYPARRYTLTLGFGYATDVKQAHQLLLDAVRAVPQVLADPPPSVSFEAFDEATIRAVVRYWLAQDADTGAAHTAVATALTTSAHGAGLPLAAQVRMVQVEGVHTAPA
ncbi:MAG TPA: mechanosensitive ion channel family protein [Caldilineaceae bacterium]|nr:mechanosensitive ion channel family protein [Caldilineaceae bacterium]